MKRIVLFGGSFNPAHWGHTIVVQQALELIPQLDELWLLPDYEHSFTKGKHFIDSQHRLALARALANDIADPRVRVESSNIDNKLSGSTHEHLQVLKEQYPNHSFDFLMGSDNLEHFSKWEQWQELLRSMMFYIYPRVGHAVENLQQGMQSLTDESQVVTNLSSTLVRQRLESGLSAKHLLTPSVETYITEHELYTRT